MERLNIEIVNDLRGMLRNRRELRVCQGMGLDSAERTFLWGASLALAGLVDIHKGSHTVEEVLDLLIEQSLKRPL